MTIFTIICRVEGCSNEDLEMKIEGGEKPIGGFLCGGCSEWITDITPPLRPLPVEMIEIGEPE